MKIFAALFLTICLVCTGSLYAGQSEEEFLGDYFKVLKTGDISQIMADNIQVRSRHEHASPEKLEAMHSYIEKLYKNAVFKIDEIETIGPGRRRADVRIKYVGDNSWTEIQLFLLNENGKWQIFNEVSTY